MLQFWVIVIILGLRALGTKATTTAALTTSEVTNVTSSASNETAMLATTATGMNETLNDTFTIAYSSNETVTQPATITIGMNETLNETSTIASSSNETVTQPTTINIGMNETLNETFTIAYSSNETVTQPTTLNIGMNETLNETSTIASSSNETVTQTTTTAIAMNETLNETSTIASSSNETVTQTTTTAIAMNETLNETSTIASSSNETLTQTTTTAIAMNETLNETSTIASSSNETVTQTTTTFIGMNETLNETTITASPSNGTAATPPVATVSTSAPNVSEAMSTEGVVTTQSTTTLTTTITAGQTTTLPPYIQPPNFGAAPPFKMAFKIGFNKTWTNDLGDPSSPGFRSFKYSVDQEIDKAFEGCPGYIPFSANVTRFYNVSDVVATRQKVSSLMRSGGVPTLQATEDNVHADYQTSYDNKVIIEGGDATSKSIENQTIPRLSSALFGDSVGVLQSSLTDMTATAQSSVSALQNDPCQAIGTYICTVCYPCSKSPPSNVTCVATCRDDNKVCTVTGTNTGCNCKNKYLPVADGCVHENVIIGATTGVVGAALLGLVIAVIILCCKPKKKEIQTMSYERMRTYELVKVPTADKAVATAEGESVELVTFPRNQNVLAKSDSNGAAPITKERASSVSSYDTKSISNSDRLPSEKQHTSPYQYYPFTFGKELRDEDLPKEITSSDVFVEFAPRLDHVDPYAEYSIRRPAALLQQKTSSTMPVEADLFF